MKRLKSDLVSVLEEINEIINSYESGVYIDQHDLISMQRKLSCFNYMLTVEFDAYRKKWNAEVYGRPQSVTGKKESVASAEIRADYKYPEKEQIIKILGAIENVSISISQELKIMLND